MSLRCYNRVALLLALLLAAAALLPILTYAPNRLVSGAALSLPQAFPAFYGGL
ncbi:MAG TPA: ABC transporter permease, partial [Franconibacter pulveris]|nr:ABC transporter permease [Franconibacter pulveris]